MSDKAISVSHLYKQYAIGERQPYKLLRDAITHPFQKSISNEYFWALHDVSFEITSGDVIGIIGKNGSGKSTLLKILTRITPPTKGEITLRGRVASLLEVGTGFSPEFTGKENIYLNGSILGMKKSEIKKKYDEIVEFSGVEKFIDTPVKRYSSGMYVRLAFAVAAHLNSDILLVDEVLAVGDFDFQKKCLQKMETISKSGRTILFVSHNLGAIKNICNKTIWIDKGIVKGYDISEPIIKQYLNDGDPRDLNIEKQIALLPIDPLVKLKNIRLKQGSKVIGSDMENGLDLHIEIKFEIFQFCKQLRVYYDLIDSEDELLIRSFHDEDKENYNRLFPGKHILTTSLPKETLPAGKYKLKIKFTVHNDRSCLGNGLSIPLHIHNTSKYNATYPNDPCRSKLALHIPWKFN